MNQNGFNKTYMYIFLTEEDFFLFTRPIKSSCQAFSIQMWLWHLHIRSLCNFQIKLSKYRHWRFFSWLFRIVLVLQITNSIIELHQVSLDIIYWSSSKKVNFYTSFTKNRTFYIAMTFTHTELDGNLRTSTLTSQTVLVWATTSENVPSDMCTQSAHSLISIFVGRIFDSKRCKVLSCEERSITKTRLLKYTENFTTKKKWKVSDKKFWYFS